MKNLLSKLNLLIFVFLFVNCKSESIVKQTVPVVPAVSKVPLPISVTNENDSNILFVGNSHTYVNNIPLMVQQIGAAENLDIIVEDISIGNYAIIDHIDEGRVQGILKNNKFDFVISQQGPSSLPSSLVLLKEGASALAQECLNAKAGLFLYTIWPDKSRFQFLDDVIANYNTAAKSVGAGVCPAGLAWKYAFFSNPNIQLYGSDLSHASPKGSLLSAMTIYAAIYKKSNLDFLEFDKSPVKEIVNKEEFELFKAVIADLDLEK